MPNLLSTLQQQGVDVFGGVWPLVWALVRIIANICRLGVWGGRVEVTERLKEEWG